MLPMPQKLLNSVQECGVKGVRWWRKREGECLMMDELKQIRFSSLKSLIVAFRVQISFVKS
jgi:hypothetical protein